MFSDVSVDRRLKESQPHQRVRRTDSGLIQSRDASVRPEKEPSTVFFEVADTSVHIIIIILQGFAHWAHWRHFFLSILRFTVRRLICVYLDVFCVFLFHTA